MSVSEGSPVRHRRLIALTGALRRPASDSKALLLPQRRKPMGSQQSAHLLNDDVRTKELPYRCVPHRSRQGEMRLSLARSAKTGFAMTVSIPRHQELQDSLISCGPLPPT